MQLSQLISRVQGVPDPLREGDGPGLHSSTQHVPSPGRLTGLGSFGGKMVVKLKSSVICNACSYQRLEAVSGEVGDKNECPHAFLSQSR